MTFVFLVNGFIYVFKASFGGFELVKALKHKWIIFKKIIFILLKNNRWNDTFYVLEIFMFNDAFASYPIFWVYD